MKKIIENIAARIFGCKINNKLSNFTECPWFSARATYQEVVNVYKWDPQTGFQDVTREDYIPTYEAIISPQRDAEEYILVQLTIKDINKFPPGNYLITRYEYQDPDESGYGTIEYYEGRVFIVTNN